jgi:hypothetical protein
MMGPIPHELRQTHLGLGLAVRSRPTGTEGDRPSAAERSGNPDRKRSDGGGDVSGPGPTVGRANSACQQPETPFPAAARTGGWLEGACPVRERMPKAPPACGSGSRDASPPPGQMVGDPAGPCCKQLPERLLKRLLGACDLLDDGSDLRVRICRSLAGYGSA